MSRNIQGTNAGVHFDEHVLGLIFRILAVPHQAECDGKDKPFVLRHQVLKRTGIVGEGLLAPRYQCFW